MLELKYRRIMKNIRSGNLEVFDARNQYISEKDTLHYAIRLHSMLYYAIPYDNIQYNNNDVK